MDEKIAIALTVVLSASALVAITPATSGAALRTRKFQTPSKNIGCRLGRGTLRCDVLSGLNPEPKRRCDLDWVGLFLEVQGLAAPNCAGDTVYDRNAPVLEYGRRWKRRGVVCISRETGLTCKNSRGKGFFLSRNDWDTF